MGFLFKIIQRIIVPLLFLSFVRSLMRDLLSRAGGGSGSRRNWQRSFGGQKDGTGNGMGGGFSSAPVSPYEILGLPRTASDAEIRARYRELIAKYHPDKFAGMNDPEFTRLAEQKFQQVQGAYEELKRRHGF